MKIESTQALKKFKMILSKKCDERFGGPQDASDALGKYSSLELII